VRKTREAPPAISLWFMRSERVDTMTDTKNLLGVYSIVPGEGGRDLWVEIGHATRHDDGRGFDLTLRALPLEPRLVLREPLQTTAEDAAAPSLASQVREFERAAISQCLLETGGNIAAALERLKIPRRTLNEKMARLGIDRRRLTPPLRHNGTSRSEHAERSVEHAGDEPDAFIEQPRWAKNGALNGQ
jgi:Bacterial regulatory protein, Fis family